MGEERSYGISGARLLRGHDRPFVSEIVYTNDPAPMVKHCLECSALSCDRGECPYTKTGEGRKKKTRRLPPPLPLEMIDRAKKMRFDGWRVKMIARELHLAENQVVRALDWADKEAKMGITSETRREAYEGVDITNMEFKVLSVIREKGGASSEEIMDALGTKNPNNVRPRLTALRDKGVIEQVGKRKNRSGCNEAVWREIK